MSITGFKETGYNGPKQPKLYLAEEDGKYFRLTYYEPSSGFQGIIHPSNYLCERVDEYIGIVYPMFDRPGYYTAENMKTRTTYNFKGQNCKEGLNWLLSDITNQKYKDWLKIGDEEGLYDADGPELIGEFAPEDY